MTSSHTPPPRPHRASCAPGRLHSAPMVHRQNQDALGLPSSAIVSIHRGNFRSRWSPSPMDISFRPAYCPAGGSNAGSRFGTARRRFRRSRLSHQGSGGRANTPVRLRVLSDGNEAVQYLSRTGPFRRRAEFPLPALVLLGGTPTTLTKLWPLCPQPSGVSSQEITLKLDPPRPNCYRLSTIPK